MLLKPAGSRFTLALCLMLVALLSACQSAPTSLSTEGTEVEQLDPAESQGFDEEELVIAVENDDNTPRYLQPQFLQSPLAINNNIWERVRKGFTLDYYYNDKRIDAQMPWFINNQDYLDRVNTRASRYLWHIVEEIEKRNMPMEIALLPIVESAYDPFAYSHARASGVWQFIASTARIMGLRLDWWYDGRRDILASTDASLDLLQLLHDNLNDDWLLALAAYNSGEGNVRKAIKKNKRKGKPTDFWHLDLPKETRAYVPKLLALTRLYMNPQKYNIYVLPIPNESYFDVVETGSQIDLAQAAKLSNVPLEELYLLNPAFNRWATSPAGPHHLLVPKQQAEPFRVALTSFPPEKRIAWEHYTVQSGDSLGIIADRYNTTAYDLMRINKLKSNTIRAGSVLMIPVASSKTYSLSAEERQAQQLKRVKASADSERFTYVVKRGDTFSTLAKRYGTSAKKLAESNGMALRDPLRIGQKLTIWAQPNILPPSRTPPEAPDLSDTSVMQSIETTAEDTGTSETPPTESGADSTQAEQGTDTTESITTAAGTAIAISDESNEANNIISEKMTRKISYRVRSGDTLNKISKKFRVSIAQIIEWNKIDPDRYLRKGQKLTLYVDVAESY